jgi:8-amino-7-oxononanoate synthase
MADLFDKFVAAWAERSKLQMGDLPDPIGVVMEAVTSPTEAIIQGRPTILVGTYNYLGLTFHPEVIAAGQQALAKFGSGTTGSRVLNGTYAGHKALEETIARFYGMQHCIVFSTGYQANLGMCSALAQKGDYIIIDADSHASIYDGCSLGNAEVVRFRHNSPDDLAKRLARLPADAGKLVVLEGVYSMLGDIGPLKDLVAASKESGARIMVDEAHAMGFFGKHGRGVIEAADVQNDIDVVVGTFSKSIGTIGGFAVSSHPKFDIARLMARPYVFTASLPPSVVATATTAFEIMQREPERAERLWARAHRLHGGLKSAGFPLVTETAESAIVAIRMPDQDTTVKFWAAALLRGVYVNMARPPATPQGLCLIRMSICADHTAEQVEQIIERLTAAAKEAGLPLTAPRPAIAAE